jgi:hypothetical protein
MARLGTSAGAHKRKRGFGVSRARAGCALLICALLAAWQSALLHPLQHLDKQGQLVHLGSAKPIGDKQGSSDPSQLCDALAGLSDSCAGDGNVAFPNLSSEYRPIFDRAGVPPASARPPFLAQAPPLFS